MPSIDTQRTYNDVVHLMQPGDVIAFGGVGLLSDLVKRTTRSTVSHVAVIQQAATATGDAVLVEATVTADPKANKDPVWRVTPQPCRNIVNSYQGDVFWLPLEAQRRGQSFQKSAFDTHLQTIQGTPFDVLGGGGVLLNKSIRELFDLDIFDGGKDEKLLFCSELVALALMKAGMVAGINASDMSPADVCGWSIYEPTAVRLKGTAADIPGWNTSAPGQAAGSRESILKAFADVQMQKMDAKAPAFQTAMTKLQGWLDPKAVA